MLAACVLVGCQGIAPAGPELVTALERCADPIDDAALEEAARELDRGHPHEVLRSVRALLPRNPRCARLSILARRALSAVPERDQPKIREEFRSLFADLLRANSDAVASASLAFGIAQFARDDDERRRWLRNALESRDDHYYALCKHGEELWFAGRLELAREALQKVVALRESLAEGWLLLARVAEDRGFYKTADKRYQTYLGLRPLDRQAKLNYARLLVHLLRDGDRAEPIIDELYAANPTDLEVGLNRGLVYYLQRRWNDAERTYKDLLRRYPSEPRLALSLGNLYYGAMKQPVKALQAYRYFMSLSMSDDPQTALHYALFAPQRIKDITQTLEKDGAAVPAPPSGIEAVLGYGQ